MPNTYSPEVISEYLKQQGIDPSRFTIDDNFNVIEKTSQPALATKPSDVTKASAFKTGAISNIGGTIGGLGAPALVAGAGLLSGVGTIPTIAALVGTGLVGSYAGGKAQQAIEENILSPEQQASLATERQQAAEQQPIANLVGELAPQALALRPSISGLRNAGKAISKLPALAKTNPELYNAPLTAVEKAALSNVAIGGGLGGGIEATQELIREGKLDPAKIAINAAAGAVLNEPWLLGPKLGLHPTPKEANADVTVTDYTQPAVGETTTNTKTPINAVEPTTLPNEINDAALLAKAKLPIATDEAAKLAGVKDAAQAGLERREALLAEEAKKIPALQQEEKLKNLKLVGEKPTETLPEVKMVEPELNVAKQPVATEEVKPTKTADQKIDELTTSVKELTEQLNKQQKPVEATKSVVEQPVATKQNEIGFEKAFKGLAKGATDDFYNQAFETLKKGNKAKVGGLHEKNLDVAKPYIDSGLIKSAKELRDWIQSGKPNLNPKPVELSEPIKQQISDLQEFKAEQQRLQRLKNDEIADEADLNRLASLDKTIPEAEAELRAKGVTDADLGKTYKSTESFENAPKTQKQIDEELRVAGKNAVTGIEQGVPSESIDGALGETNPVTGKVRLSEKADKTTVLHETVHNLFGWLRRTGSPTLNAHLERALKLLRDGDVIFRDKTNPEHTKAYESVVARDTEEAGTVATSQQAEKLLRMRAGGVKQWGNRAKQWWKDLESMSRARLGNETAEDVRNLLARRLVDHPGYYESGAAKNDLQRIAALAANSEDKALADTAKTIAMKVGYKDLTPTEESVKKAKELGKVYKKPLKEPEKPVVKKPEVDVNKPVYLQEETFEPKQFSRLGDYVLTKAPNRLTVEQWIKELPRMASKIRRGEAEFNESGISEWLNTLDKNSRLSRDQIAQKFNERANREVITKLGNENDIETRGSSFEDVLGDYDKDKVGATIFADKEQKTFNGRGDEGEDEYHYQRSGDKVLDIEKAIQHNEYRIASESRYIDEIEMGAIPFSNDIARKSDLDATKDLIEYIKSENQKLINSLRRLQNTQKEPGTYAFSEHQSVDLPSGNKAYVLTQIQSPLHQWKHATEKSIKPVEKFEDLPKEKQAYANHFIEILKSLKDEDTRKKYIKSLILYEEPSLEAFSTHTLATDAGIDKSVKDFYIDNYNVNKYNTISKKEQLSKYKNALYQDTRDWVNKVAKIGIQDAIKTGHDTFGWAVGKKIADYTDENYAGSVYELVYDKLMPKLMSEYAKERGWNTSLNKNDSMWSMKITPEMKSDVELHGTSLYSKESFENSRQAFIGNMLRTEARMPSLAEMQKTYGINAGQMMHDEGWFKAAQKYAGKRIVYDRVNDNVQTMQDKIFGHFVTNILKRNRFQDINVTHEPDPSNPNTQGSYDANHQGTGEINAKPHRVLTADHEIVHMNWDAIPYQMKLDLIADAVKRDRNIIYEIGNSVDALRRNTASYEGLGDDMASAMTFNGEPQRAASYIEPALDELLAQYTSSDKNASPNFISKVVEPILGKDFTDWYKIYMKPSANTTEAGSLFKTGYDPLPRNGKPLGTYFQNESFENRSWKYENGFKYTDIETVEKHLRSKYKDWLYNPRKPLDNKRYNRDIRAINLLTRFEGSKILRDEDATALKRYLISDKKGTLYWAAVNKDGKMLNAYKNRSDIQLFDRPTGDNSAFNVMSQEIDHIIPVFITPKTVNIDKSLGGYGDIAHKNLTAFGDVQISGPKYDDWQTMFPDAEDMPAPEVFAKESSIVKLTDLLNNYNIASDVEKSDEWKYFQNESFSESKLGRIITSPISHLTGEVDKVRAVAPKLGEAFDQYYEKYSRNLGEVNDILIPTRNLLMKNATLRDKWYETSPSAKRVLENWYALDDKKPLPHKLNANEQKALDGIIEYVKHVGEQRNLRGLEHKTLHVGEVTGRYAPNIVDRAVLRTILGPETEAKTRLINDFIKYQKELDATDVQAKEKLNEFLGGYQKRGEVNIAEQYGPLDKAAGTGLPPSWRERNLFHVLQRYGDRVARRLAYHDTVETNADAMKQYESNKSVEVVQNVIDDIAGIRDKAEARREVVGGLIRSGMMQSMTGARDLASSVFLGWQHLSPSQVTPTLVNSFKHFKQNLAETYSMGINRERVSALEVPDYLETDEANWIQSGRRVRDLTQKFSGREYFEKSARAIDYGIGKSAAADNVNALRNGSASSQQLKFLKDFSPVDIDTLRSKGATEAQLREMAARFTESVQGKYDLRELPVLATRGSWAPVLSLARWNIGKFNNFRKYVVDPAIKEHNFTPLLMQTVGALLGGTVVTGLTSMLTQRKERAPSWDEIKYAYENDGKFADSLMYKLAGLASNAGYAGIMGDIARTIQDKMHGNTAQGYNNILLDFAARNTELLTQAVKAWDDGNFEVGLSFLDKLVENNIQNARLVMRFASEEKQENIEKSNKMRDLRAFRQTSGLPTSDLTSVTTNPFEHLDEKKFKRTEDVSEAAGMLPTFIQKAYDKANEAGYFNPETFKQELGRLKRNNYQTMPSPESMPLQFRNYLAYLTQTQGADVAAARLEDYMKKTTINRVKSGLVP